jgi:Zn-dependent peptidase ImmA (M78 family)
LIDDPESRAEELRALLGITVKKQVKEFRSHSAAENAWRSVLFDHGIIVRVCNMPISDARAFCLFKDDLAGIGLSNEDREHARIFSLFHEVCHLGLRQPGVSGMPSNARSANQRLEQYCDHFAASFLLPSSDSEVIGSMELFRGSFEPLELSLFISKKFKVSKYVAIRRAYDLGTIEPNIYWRIMSEWKLNDLEYAAKERAKKKRSGDYYATQISYIGRRFINLVMEGVERNHLTPVEATRILGLDPVALEMNLR